MQNISINLCNDSLRIATQLFSSKMRSAAHNLLRISVLIGAVLTKAPISVRCTENRSWWHHCLKVQVNLIFYRNFELLGTRTTRYHQPGTTPKDRNKTLNYFPNLGSDPSSPPGNRRCELCTPVHETVDKCKGQLVCNIQPTWLKQQLLRRSSS